MLKGIAFVILLLLVAGIVLIYRHNRTEVEISPENRTRFAQVAILIDGTRSTGEPETHFADVKQIVRQKILPSLGMDDTVTCYDVRSDFDSRVNLVFGGSDDQPPRHLEEKISAEEIRTALKEKRENPRVTTRRMDKLIRHLESHDLPLELQRVRMGWSQKLEELQPPVAKGSDICDPLLNLADLLRQGDPQAEKWLFLLTDLRNETAAEICETTQPFPSDTHIVWIYPLGADSPSWKSVPEFWRPLFGNQVPDRISFTTALAGKALLHPNPTAGLKRDNPGK